MTDVLHSPSSQNPSSSDSFFIENPNSSFSIEEEDLDSIEGGGEKGEFSFFTLFIDLLRKSLASSCTAGSSEIAVMDIGEPTDVRHVSHVTFDRFDGFLGLPLEFEPEVPRRAPSASTSVFGVSTESMQLSFDARGNCVPTILVLMQRRLYAQGGLQEEGIFRITADNSHEEFVRDQLNEGVVPDDIDVHCLAGLIKAWFRELPTGVLDPLSPEDVMHCESEEDCTELVKQLPATEGALLNWAINLMADVVQEEHHNRMNAHNIAMVFAPNMTQMADPLTALMYAVQVMNFLKTLITKTLQDREDSSIEPGRASYTEPSDESGHQSPSPISPEAHHSEDTDESESEQSHSEEDDSFSYSPRLPLEDGSESDDSPFHWQSFKGLQSSLSLRSGPMFQSQYRASRLGQTSNSVKEPEVVVSSNTVHPMGPVERLKSICNLSRISSRIEFTESWR
ncbi:rho GTPase-activating protein 5-like [Silene latifolia]|uniref:rho GTPase-activating protein 5-like n=1 Tax=Silene latifolia TaxID=37657 RepID=UPI003D789448